MPSAIARWVLPVPGGPEQDDVLAAGEEVELAEVQHRVAADRGLEGEVELLQRLAGGEARGLDAALAAVAVAAVDLGLQQRGGELLIAPLLRAGAVGELGQRPRRGRRLQRAEQVRELGASGGSCDQRVIARPASGPRRPARAPRRSARWALSARACSSAVIVRCLANDRGVPAGQLAGVQRDREDLALGRRAPRRGGRPAAGRASSRRCRSAGRGPAGPAAPSADRCRAPIAGSGAITCALLDAAGRSAGSAASCACAGSRARRTRRRAAAGSRARWRTRRPGSKLRSMKSCRRSTHALGLRIARRRRSASRPAAAPQNAANASVGRPPPACSPAWRSQTSVCGSAPSDHRQRRIPNNRSGVCLEKISAPAPARE